MAHPSQLVQYLRRCYEADNRETGITDLFRSRHRHVYFLSGEEVALSGTVECAPLPRQVAEEARKESFKYRRDKQLVYACLPIVGPTDSGHRLADPLCAPLVFFPSRIEEKKGALFLQPDWDELRINFPVLNSLSSVLESDGEALESYLLSLTAPPWPRERVHTLAASLATLLPKVDFTRLAAFPVLSDGAQVAELAKSLPQLACLPACAMALLPNSPDTRGVLFELDEMARIESYSSPVANVLSGASPHVSSDGRVRRACAPSVLSAAQEQVLASASHSPLTLVVGPPGTGKSHTIASLAIDHLSRGETVLIASRMEQAVNVVGDKICELLGPSHAILRAGRKQHLRDLKSLLENLLQGIAREGHAESRPARRWRKQLRQLDRSLQSLEQLFAKQVERERVWGELESAATFGWWNHSLSTLRKRFKCWQLEGFNAWDCMQQYQRLSHRRSQTCRSFIQALLSERLQRLLKQRRADLSKFLQAIRSRSDSKQQRLFREIDFSVLLNAFPVWLCELSDLSHVLPLERGLFDVVILDEASQCDIASSLPLLQRGKRAVVVGDPKQLRHISFLPQSRQESIATDMSLSQDEMSRLSFRSRSILDAASDSLSTQASVIFLNEHFRSQPEIIRFSNQAFYAGSLSIMREHPRPAPLHPVELRFVGGTRSTSGPNAAEVEAVARTVAALIQEQHALPEHQCASIGVLSPLREQVDALSNTISEQLSFEQMQRHNLLIGTAHTFQGEERDVMCLSLALDDDSHWASFRFLNDAHVLNVSITRARHRQIVFHSFDPGKLETDSLLYRYLADFSDQQPARTVSSRSVPTEIDAFREHVVEALSPGEFRVWRDHAVAGIVLDLVLASPQTTVGLDLIGYPGRLEAAYPMERYRMLARAGLEVYPLSYRDWLQSKSACVSAITRVLE